MIIVQDDLFAPPRMPSTVAVDKRGKADTSRDAGRRARAHASSHEQLVYDAIVAAGVRGATRKELSHICGFAEGQQNRITWRVASLIKREAVRQLTTTRDGSHVLICNRYANA